MMYSIRPFGYSGFDSFFDDFDRDFFPSARQSSAAAFRTDIRDEGDHYLLEAELPGFSKGDIDLNLQDGVLTITAKHDETNETKDKQGHYVCRERRIGSFQRSFNVEGVRQEDISASYDNGVLKLVFPKPGEAPRQSHKIAIQ